LVEMDQCRLAVDASGTGAIAKFNGAGFKLRRVGLSRRADIVDGEIRRGGGDAKKADQRTDNPGCLRPSSNIFQFFAFSSRGPNSRAETVRTGHARAAPADRASPDWGNSCGRPTAHCS